MNRWDVINYFIQKRKAKRYLEIGYYKGWSFDRVECDFKAAVDPNPCKTKEQEKAEAGSTMSEGDGLIYKMESDEYFATRQSSIPCFDVIFIDGLHEREQVYKDVINSLELLSDDGFIIMHDCNPPLYKHTTTGIDGCWTGDTYKAFIDLRINHPDYTVYTIDTDWGIGVIQPYKKIVDDSPILFQPKNWTEFDNNREHFLNLISVKDFLNQ